VDLAFHHQTGRESVSRRTSESEAADTGTPFRDRHLRIGAACLGLVFMDVHVEAPEPDIAKIANVCALGRWFTIMPSNANFRYGWNYKALLLPRFQLRRRTADELLNGAD